ncbi:hypothetical protein ACG33_14115 [Steroidobacter denitrificans]|uniref:Translocation and assembly module TamB C-terminal domain-containing protein n=1 Tax=Steroidobacter denitrificans TaxID=465721 RepID=A0A127FCV1_STEDE|nr:translocation/assembly module TamB domain-containing protein [Steroidobacter denitrificans]AMN48212.1 hypothetical protein ACG33_14115 [Steroidobacter denitrificans]
MRKSLLIVSILLIMLPGTLIAGLFYTETGLALIAGQLGRLERFGIHVQGVSGTLAGPLRIERFELDHPLVQVISHDIVVDLQLRALILQTLRSRSLTARDTQVVLHERQAPSRGDRPLRFLPSYLRIDARGVDLHEVRYVHMNGMAVDAHRVRGQAAIGARQIDIENTRIDAGQFDAAGRLRLRAGRTLSLHGHAEGHVRMPRGVEYALTGRLDGPVDRLAIQGALHTAVQASALLETATGAATGKAEDQTPDGTRPETRVGTQARAELLVTQPEGRWHLAGRIEAADFSLAPWLDDPPFSLRDADLKIAADPQRIEVVGTLAIPEYDSGTIFIDTVGAYAQHRLRITGADLALVDSPVKVHAAGSIAFQEGGPTLSLQARWQALQWPLRTLPPGTRPAARTLYAPLLVSPEGTASLQGRLPYDFTLTARIEGPQIPAALGSAHGRLSARTLEVEHYELAVLEGRLNGSGQLQFAQPHRWWISTQAEGINPRQLHAELPGRLDGRMHAGGAGLDPQANFTLVVDELTGKLRSQDLRAHGEFRRNRTGWAVRGARLDYADAAFRLDASLDDRIDARWALHAPRLEKLWPGLQGAIDFSGAAGGDSTAPRIAATARGTALGYQEWALRSLDLDLGIGIDGDGDGADEAVDARRGLAGNTAADADSDDLASGGDTPSGTPSSRLRLHARGLAYGEVRIDALDVDGDGTPGAHRIDVELAGVATRARAPAPYARMRIDGRYIRRRWDALLTMTQLSTGLPKDEISTPGPARILVSRDRVTVNDLCLVAGAGRLCADGRWERRGSWEGIVAGYEIPLALILPSRMADAEYAGRIEGRARVFGSAGETWQADAGMRIVDAAILYRPQTGETETLHLGTGGLAATATPQRVDFSFGLQAFTDTYVYANAHLRRDGAGLMHLPLSAEVRARAADANILPLFFPEVDHAAGLFTANIGITGTLARPELRGRLALADGEFDSYRINLALRGLSLTADLDENWIDLQGSAHAGNGRLDIDGRLAWQEGESRGNLHLHGVDLLVADLPDYRVIAAPDLQFRIDGRQIGITGEVIIPSARIQPAQIGGAVRLSEDARYVGEHAAETAGRYDVHSDVRIVMGDDVRIDAFGLQGRIQGAVGTILHTGDTPRGRGELSVAEGRYEAYGQKLDINRGRLLFDTSSLDDPGLDMEARRDLDTVTVGLNVRGTLREPRLTFFSDPSMPQTQIVSYLLTGRSMDTMRSGDRMTMDSARGSLAYQGGGLLASQIGRRLGFEEVGVESTVDSTGEDNTSLVIGKFLSPRLFISYGISLTESINTLKLRYTISDRWIFRTEAGENQSADLEYTIER